MHFLFFFRIKVHSLLIMKEILEIKVAIQSHFHHFNHNKDLCDCILISPTDQIMTQRIFLSYHSKYFRKFFTEHKNDKLPISFELPCNPDNAFQDIFKLLQLGEIKLTLNNIIQLLKVLDFYEIDHYRKEMEIFLKDSVNSSIFMNFVDKCKELDFPGGCDIIMHTIVDNLVIPDMGLVPISVQRLLYRCHPITFAKILKHQSHVNMTDKRKASLIDDYIHHQFEISEDQRYAFAKVINWDDPNSYQLFYENNINWCPPSVARPHIRKALKCRLNSTKIFADRVKEKIANTSPLQEDKKSISRWYPFQWVNFISNASLENKDPKYSLIDFITKLGQLNIPIDPEIYGLFNISNSQPLTHFFAPKFAFLPDRYFISRTDISDLFIQVNFGEYSCFKINSIFLDTTVKKMIHKGYKPMIKSIQISNESEILLETDNLHEGANKFEISGDNHMSTIKIKSTDKIEEVNLFRIKFIDFVGCFI